MKNKINPFLTGAWTDLIMLVYEYDPEELKSFIPKDLELHLWQGKAYISIVAFTFSNAKFFGIQLPNHKQFGQINLRTYVKSKTTGETGVLFLKEMCPKPLICLTGKYAYYEPFIYRKVKRLSKDNHVEYKLERKRKKFSIALKKSREAVEMPAGSLANFIVNNHISFSRFSKEKSKPFYIQKEKPWQVFKHKNLSFSKDIFKMYNSPYQEILDKQPVAAYSVDGSKVEVYS